MSLGKIIKNEVFSISTILMIGIPLTAALTSDSNIREMTSKKLSAALPSITSSMPKTDISSKIEKSLKATKRTITGQQYSFKTPKSGNTKSSSRSLYINKNR